MKAVGQFQSIWLYRPFVDMRKQIAGLSEVVQTEMKLDPFKPGLFVFCNRRRDLLKCIYWDASGFAMWVKKLDQDKFPWPKKANDAVITMAIFVFVGKEVNIPVLAAILTLIGYSLNDTIVIYDRVRENFRKVRKETPKEIMNLSINQTLSRTIMTSTLTLIVVVALYFLGGESLRGFSLALIIGIIVGTYSSIFVAGALALSMGLSRADLMPSAKKVVDDMP